MILGIVLIPNGEHAEIVGGWDENGNILMIHCSGGRNNVVISGRQGFTMIGVPNCYNYFFAHKTQIM